MSEPAYREFRFTAMAQPDQTAELISILSQAMDSYKDISPSDRNAVAEWFNNRFAAQTDVNQFQQMGYVQNEQGSWHLPINGCRCK